MAEHPALNREVQGSMPWGSIRCGSDTGIHAGL